MTLSRAEAPFVVVGGSVTGGDHRRAYRDGQDGFARVASPRLSAAIVTDGCSAGRASEVGARLGAAWLAEIVARVFVEPEAEARPREAARRVAADLVLRLEWAARSLSAEGAIEPAIVGEMFLFGFLCAVVTPRVATVFGVGDGIAWVDGAATVVDPGPENAPPYPAYALLGAEIEPRILHLGPASEVDAVAVATDGAAPLLADDADPRFEDVVRDVRVFDNPSLLHKRLVALADRGRFFDDVTVGLVRRRPA